MTKIRTMNLVSCLIALIVLFTCLQCDHRKTVGNVFIDPESNLAYAFQNCEMAPVKKDGCMISYNGLNTDKYNLAYCAYMDNPEKWNVIKAGNTPLLCSWFGKGCIDVTYVQRYNNSIMCH